MKMEGVPPGTTPAVSAARLASQVCDQDRSADLVGRLPHVDDLNDPILKALANLEPGQCWACWEREGRHKSGCIETRYASPPQPIPDAER